MNLFTSAILLLFGAAVVSSAAVLSDWIQMSDLEQIDAINRLNTSWKAGPSIYSPEQFKILLGVKELKESNLPVLIHDEDILVLPEEFDSRKNWPHCTTIGTIHNQGMCGSCWAVSATRTMSDRVCIHSLMHENIELSANEMLSCCDGCVYGDGCDGGFLDPAWDYYIKNGLVTGGLFNTDDGCQPYQIPSIDDIPFYIPFSAPECIKSCEEGYNITFEDDKRYGVEAYSIQPKEKQIMTEIYLNGPVQASFVVYEDFKYYVDGVYTPECNDIAGHHAVTMIGWGIENNIPYWLCANSWGVHWGGMKGYFKIRRGECKINEGIKAGFPMLI